MFESRIDWKAEIQSIREAGAAGMSKTRLAEKYGVTKQRMHQVIKRYVPEWEGNYGYSVKAKEKQELWKSKWGDKNNSDLYKCQRVKFSRKKANAIRIGHEWTISFGELDWPTHCPILGIELDYFLEYRAENSPSFDQIIPGKGYVSGNVQILSWRANRIKNDGTAEEHRKIADYLSKIE